MKPLTLLLALMMLSTFTYGQKIFAPVDTTFIPTRHFYLDTVSIHSIITGTHTLSDKNGVVIDQWRGYIGNTEGVWYVCSYKKIPDTGYEFVLRDNNWLYIFKDRKVIKKYYSRTGIERR